MSGPSGPCGCRQFLSQERYSLNLSCSQGLHLERPKGRELFIVDNSVSGWTGLRYLEEWSSIAKAFDIATGYFAIGALLTLNGKWQGSTRSGSEPNWRMRANVSRKRVARRPGGLRRLARGPDPCGRSVLLTHLLKHGNVVLWLFLFSIRRVAWAKPHWQ